MIHIGEYFPYDILHCNITISYDWWRSLSIHCYGHRKEIEYAFVQNHQFCRKRNTMMKISLKAHNQTLSLLKKSFRIHYFLYIIDKVICWLKRRFEQYDTYEEIIGFLFSVERLKSFSNRDLKLHCEHLETYLKHDTSYDLDGKNLFEELKFIIMVLTIELKSSFMI